jgi:hypothetical protein
VPKSEGNHEGSPRDHKKSAALARSVSGVDFCYFDLNLCALPFISYISACRRQAHGCCERTMDVCLQGAGDSANKKRPFCSAPRVRVEFMLGSVPHNGILRRLWSH